ncbi:hypothetical protein [Agrobacterium sp. OT33]|uniref:hypothetical protein n=1 Tax=Agrobacterium sp. OT33 TaxID=2815338 RepID=UPI001A8F878A|nr:hypothetical protein [Agrobacterium sp. OT33]MBO0128367.1 hypothetical protein [Agrobacterium sp. OT33]
MIVNVFAVLPCSLIGLGGLVFKFHSLVAEEAAGDGCYVDSEDMPSGIANMLCIASAIHQQREDLHCKASA